MISSISNYHGPMARLRDRPDVEFFASLAMIGRLADQRLERASPEGLSLAGLTVLNQLAGRSTAPSPQELARALRLSKAAITNTLQRLERESLITVAADPDDGRRKRVALSAGGLSAQRTALASIRPRLEALRAAFDPADFEAALPLLRRLLGWLEAEA
jgi:DNA-binding MarR family transcriptional regulator